MKKYKNEFIYFLLKEGALLFGDFTIKSGRKSPYFFNLGKFHSGSSLKRLGEFYAAALVDCKLRYDFLFGPAYKGIPLVSTTAIALSTLFNQDVPYCFNRKEKKTHGDQGHWVGCHPQGNMVMLDDVISAGTTVRETLDLIKPLSITLTGILIAFDRQERGADELSATQSIIQNMKIPVFSIINLQDLIDYLKDDTQLQNNLPAILSYREKYGAF